MKYEVFWKNPGYRPRPRLQHDTSCEYLIVGGGITGVSLAYFLNAYGAKNVALIEKNTVASGATGKAAGSLVLKGELDIQDIIREFGQEKGVVYWRANHRALSTLKDIIRKERIDCDCDVEDTIYGSSRRGADIKVLEEYIVEKDLEKLTQLIVGKELRRKINTPLFKYAVLSHHHGISVNPLKLTQNLSLVVEKKGVQVYENTPMLHLHKNTAITPKARIGFKRIILATDADIRVGEIKKTTSTIIVTRRLSPRQLRVVRLLPKKIVWDSKDIYHYIKVTEDNRILLGYGDKRVHKKHTRIDPHKPHMKRIVSFLTKLFPGLNARIEYAWSGSIGTTGDNIPFIEKSGNRTVVGGAGSQIVCLMAAQHVARKLLGKPSSLDRFFGR